MTMEALAPAYIQSLLKPSTSKARERRAWSIPLETVWIPFLTATNTEGLTAISHEALGAPLRLAYNKDSSPKFGNNGRPVVRIAKDVAEQVRLVRENFQATLQNFAIQVRESNPEGYTQELKLNAEAGNPIIDFDNKAIEKAMAEAVEKAMESKGESKPDGAPAPEPELAGVRA